MCFNQKKKMGKPQKFSAAQMAKAIARAKGFVSVVARELNVTPQTVRNYINRYEMCKQAVNDAREAMTDIAEGKLAQNIVNNDSTSIIFYLKTQAKHRGYIERKELTGKDGEALVPKPEGQQILVLGGSSEDYIAAWVAMAEDKPTPTLEVYDAQ